MRRIDEQQISAIEGREDRLGYALTELLDMRDRGEAPEGWLRVRLDAGDLRSELGPAVHRHGVEHAGGGYPTADLDDPARLHRADEAVQHLGFNCAESLAVLLQRFVDVQSLDFLVVRRAGRFEPGEVLVQIPARNL